MRSTGSACSLLLLTMAAVSSGRNAREYFQQAGFQHSPSRPEDALVFFTNVAPPLICEQEKVGDWVGGERLKADLILKLPHDSVYYACSFEGNTTTDTNLKLIQNSLPDVFTSEGQVIIYSAQGMKCVTDSQLPNEYFQLRIQRPNEDRPIKCRKRFEGEKLYLRFPGYPTIVCKEFKFLHSYNTFNLPGIVGDQMECAFEVYLALNIGDKHTEKRLRESLVSGLPKRAEVVCFLHESPLTAANFQVRLPGDTIYDCNFRNA